MEFEDGEQLSARSTASLEDGASSARSTKSRTLARLRKLKKKESFASSTTTADRLIPHPPDALGSAERKLSNGLSDGDTEPGLNGISQLPETSSDVISKNVENVMQDDEEKLPGLGPLPSNLGDPFGPKRSLGSLSFARQGLGGLEPLSTLEPLTSLKKEKKKKSERKTEGGVEKGGIDELRDEPVGRLMEEKSGLAIVDGVMRMEGSVQTETNDFDLLTDNSLAVKRDSLKDSVTCPLNNCKSVLAIKTPSKRQIAYDASKTQENFDVEDDDNPVDILPDNTKSEAHRREKVNLAVSRALKEERTFKDSLSDFRKLEAEEKTVVEMPSGEPENILRDPLTENANELTDVIQVHQTRTTTNVEVEDDHSDDNDLVVANSPSKSSVVPKLDQEPVKSDPVQDVHEDYTHNIGQDDAGIRYRAVINGSHSDIEDDDDVVLVNKASNSNDSDDERKLKQYLENKLQEIEENGDNEAVASSSTSTLSKVGHLSPITNASTPPPLPDNFASPSLRTAYKRDDLDNSIGASEVSDAMLSSGSLSETNRSISSSMLLNTLTNKGARNRNMSYLSGGVRSSGSLVGKDELDSHLPERRLKIFVATWNMHEDKEIPENLDDLLLPEDCEYMQDIYVIGSQESCPDIPEWEIRLQETLGPTHVLLHSASHGVLHCAIYVRRDLIWFCSPVEESRVTTRPGSQFKTKGAIAVSFNFFGTSFIFIVSHFTSGDENMKDRILDYEKTLKGISLPEKVPPTRKFNILTSDFTTRFDCVFWCGDFNFRLAENKARVEGWIEQLRNGNKDDYNILLQHDQLNKAMTRNDIFKGFQEGTIRFLPTYKFDLGEDVFDTSPKARVPSYTDRVLFKCRRPSDVSLVHYSCCEEIKTSDHRPVYALFEAAVRPGKDNTITAGGMFSRQVYIEGIKRRVAKSGITKRNQTSSTVCSVM